jgi:hypothetical protein
MALLKSPHCLFDHAVKEVRRIRRPGCEVPGGVEAAL